MIVGVIRRELNMGLSVEYSASEWLPSEERETGRLQQAIVKPLEDGRRIVVKLWFDPEWPEGLVVEYAAIEKRWVDRNGNSRWRIAERPIRFELVEVP